ncbi:MAG TPA: hypothetical protein VN740_07335 [Solirubrobacteraceae bacterium]|nr:hypothetical protein [Solirubrobacteraceae bacterium]
MSVTLIIFVNVALDAALLGGLAYALARPTRLTPHLRIVAAPGARAAAVRAPARRLAHAHGASDWSVRTSRATA